MAAGGGRSTVLLIHPEENVCYQMFRTVPNKNAAIVNTLLFHPKKTTWLFCKFLCCIIILFTAKLNNYFYYQALLCMRLACAVLRIFILFFCRIFIKHITYHNLLLFIVY